MKHKTQITRQHPVYLAQISPCEHLFLVWTETQRGHLPVQLSLMRQVPFASRCRYFPDLAVTSPHIDLIVLQYNGHEPVARERHGGSVDLGVDGEKTDLAPCCAGHEHVPVDHREGVVSDEACVGQLALALLHEVLHRANVKVKGVDLDLVVEADDQDVGGVFGVLVCQHVAPREEHGRGLEDACVDS